MGPLDVSRHKFLRAAGLGSAALALGGQQILGQETGTKSSNRLSVDPQPTFDLSPYLYMQFMEPLGTTDSSVDAAWDFQTDRWREDLVEITQELAPTLMRWGGCFCSYYRWREGVGSLDQRKPMLNLLWGGIYNNQLRNTKTV